LIVTSETMDPLYPVSGLFPLGRAYGLLPISAEVCPPEMLPFGLRQAVVAAATPTEDLSTFGYDCQLQIGTVRDGEQVVPLLKHTTGQTRSVTNPDGSKPRDSDTDQRED
jgi:putative ATP-grasp target RiPP